MCYLNLQCLTNANFVGLIVFVIVVTFTHICTFLVDTFTVSTHSLCLTLIDI